jgi:hypothetical protein
MFVILFTTAAIGLGGAAEVAAQSSLPLSLEVRTDGAFPRGGAFEDRASTGIGLGVSAALQLVPNYALYGGYSRTTFDLDGAGDARAVDSGFAVGLTRAFPLGGAPLVPWVGTGVIIHDLEVEGVQNAAGESRLGFEVGGGVAVPLTPQLRLTPGLAFRRYEAPFLASQRERISYFSAGVGLNLAF